MEWNDDASAARARGEDLSGQRPCRAALPPRVRCSATRAPAGRGAWAQRPGGAREERPPAVHLTPVTSGDGAALAEGWRAPPSRRVGAPSRSYRHVAPAGVTLEELPGHRWGLPAGRARRVGAGVPGGGGCRGTEFFSASVSSDCDLFPLFVYTLNPLTFWRPTPICFLATLVWNCW